MYQKNGLTARSLAFGSTMIEASFGISQELAGTDIDKGDIGGWW